MQYQATKRQCPDLLPARMLNEYAYCPRLAYLEWVQCEWADSADTIEGKHDHRRVDVAGPLAPLESEREFERFHARSVTLSAPNAGLIARIDLVEGEGNLVTPVDYKHGSGPRAPSEAWEPDLVQIGAQALILLENGYSCEKGIIYYCGSKQRVEVPVTPELLEKTKEAAKGLREIVEAGRLPPPLEHSVKCAGCSLAGICLPDESRFLQRLPSASDRPELIVTRPDLADVRRLYPILPDALPVYVQEQGGFVAKQGECLVVKVRGETICEVPLIQVSHLAIFGFVQVSTQLIHELCSQDIPICYFSTGGWFYGFTRGLGSRNIDLRRQQFRRADDSGFCLELARRIVSAKIRNQRTFLRRNAENVSQESLRRLEDLALEATQATDEQTLLGIEGSAARIYFQNFHRVIRPRFPEDKFSFEFESRNRRPPTDPVNAMLSLCYSLLAKDCTIVLALVGLDPFLGFFHTPHHGRPALALDMMEEFRPIIADSVVVAAINTGEVRPHDFVRSGKAVALTSDGRRRLIAAYERRMDQVITHPVFGYKVAYRKLLEVQARLLGRFLYGEIPEYPAILPR